jgi:hypothetical protein
LGSLFVATPSDNSEKTFDEWFAQLDALKNCYPKKLLYCKLCGSDIALNRNKLVEAFLHSDCENLLFVDTDMVWTVPQVIRLLDDDRDIVGALMTKRSPPAIPAFGIFGELNPGEKASLVGRGRFYTDRLFEVDFVGGAFVLIKRKVFETIPAPWFLQHEKVWGDKHQPVAEDIYFCWKAREYGFKVWVDGRVQVGHKGYYVYTIHDYLRYTGLQKLPTGEYPDIMEAIEMAKAVEGAMSDASI